MWHRSARFPSLSAVLPAGLLWALAITVVGQGRTPAAIGEKVPDFEVTGLIGHDGRTRSSEWHGRPVLIANFRQHLVDGIHAAWVARDLAKEFGEKGLIVLVIDRVEWTGETWAEKWSFWLRFMVTPVWMAPMQGREWDLPIRRTQSKNDEQSLVLIGVDGTLVAEGSAELASAPKKPTDFRAKIRKLVAAELQRRDQGWGPSEAIRTARVAAYRKGDFAAALRALEVSPPADDPELAAAKHEIEMSLNLAGEHLRRLIGAGRFGEAEPLRRRLAESAKNHPKAKADWSSLEASVSGPDWERGLKLDRELKAAAASYESGQLNKVDVDDIVAVRRVAKQHAEHSVGRRAQEISIAMMAIVRATKGLDRKALQERIEKAER